MKDKIARDPGNVIAAEGLFSLYSEYIKAGFNEYQAFELTKVVMTAGIKQGGK